jgi:murein DD-endopeptidase MepM/ murein hydrolase activator NlpD
VKKLSVSLLLTILLFPAAVGAEAPMENLKSVFEAMNAQVAWDGATQRITVEQSNHVSLSFTVDSNIAIKNGVAVTMDAPVIIDPESGNAKLSVNAVYPLAISNRKGTNYTVQPGDTPAVFADGLFPLVDQTYTPFDNNYGDARSFALGFTPRVYEGIDMIARAWVPVFSAYEGKVVRIGWDAWGGWRLAIRTPDNKAAFYYAHMSGYANGVADGAFITKGQLIGFVGSTGYGPQVTSGKFDPHLHFGMYDTTSPAWVAVNPFPYLRWWESK